MPGRAIGVAALALSMVLVLSGTCVSAHFPDPPSGSVSATLTGTPKVNGQPLAVNDEIAAYSVHPVPGVVPARWERSLIGRAVVTIPGESVSFPVIGDDPATDNICEGAAAGEEIQLLLWRDAEARDYAAYRDVGGGPAAVLWPGSGSAASLDNVDFTDGQRIPLRNGAWNLFSYGVLKGYRALDRPVPTSPQLFGLSWDNGATLGDTFPLRSIGGTYDRILGNDGSGTMFWNPLLPGISTLSSLAPGYGYWVKMKPSSRPLSWMTFPGPRATGELSLRLNPGWTLAGYWDPAHVYHASGSDPSRELFPAEASDNVVLWSMGDLWSTLGGNYGRMTSFDGGGAKFWNPSQAGFSTLKYMGPGYGYWVKMAVADDLSFPTSLSDPTIPRGVLAAAADSRVTVSWSPVPEATSYNLYWSNSSAVSKSTGTRIAGVIPPYGHTGRLNGMTYYYVVTAVIGGVEGAGSLQVSASPFLPPPTITGFTPPSGIPGDAVAIDGTNFDNTAVVKFYGNVTASRTVISSTRIDAIAPEGMSTGPIVVETAGGIATSATDFTKSDIPPTIRELTGPGSVQQGQVATFTWSAATESGFSVDHYHFWLDNTSGPPVDLTGIPLPPLRIGVNSFWPSLGEHTLYLKAVDNRGLESAMASVSFSVTPPSPDVTPPQALSLSIGMTPPVALQRTISVELSGTDDVSLAGYCLSENPTPPSAQDPVWTWISAGPAYSTSRTFQLSDIPGPHTIYLWFKDQAGNVSAPATASVVLILWQKEDVTTVEGSSPSIAVDASGNPHMTYRESGRVKYSRKIGTSWETVVIDNGACSMRSLAVDSQGYAHIGYVGNDGWVRYATNRSGVFSIFVVEGGSAPTVGMAPDGGVRLVYRAGGNLRSAASSGLSWSFSDIAIQEAGTWIEEYASTVDRSGAVHATYHLMGYSFDALMYATDRTGGWVSTVIDNNGYQGIGNSIAVDNSLHVHISSYNNNNGTLSYYTDSSGAWASAKNLGRIWGITAVAVDPGGNAHGVADYYTGYRSGLMYFTNAYGAWFTPIVDGDGEYGSVAVDSQGKVHLAYRYSFSVGTDVGLGIRYAKTR